MDSLIGNLKLSEQNFGGIMYLKIRNVITDSCLISKLWEE